jgi:DNA-binding phage protein
MIKTCKTCKDQHQCTSLCPDLENELKKDTSYIVPEELHIDDVFKARIRPDEDGSDKNKRVEHSKGFVPPDLLDVDPYMEQHRMETIAEFQVETDEISKATIYNHVNAVFNNKPKQHKQFFMAFLRCTSMAQIAKQMECSKQNIHKLFVKKIMEIAIRITGKDLPNTNTGISALSFKDYWAIKEK